MSGKKSKQKKSKSSWNWRKIGAIFPDYGHYVGYRARCKSKKNCPLPIDDYDKAGQEHDKGLSDWEFLKAISKVPPWKFKRPIYGNFHRLLAMTAFIPVVAIGSVGKMLKKK